MLEADKLNRVLAPLILRIHVLRDALDGLETIMEQSQGDIEKHSGLFKKCYQKFCAYGEELGEQIKQLLFMQKQLSDPSPEEVNFQSEVEGILHSIAMEDRIANKVRNEGGRHLLETLPENHISHPSSALHEYKRRASILTEIEGLVQKIEKGLGDLYFQKTDIQLLFSPRELPKRQEILQLFEVCSTEDKG